MILQCILLVQDWKWWLVSEKTKVSQGAIFSYANEDI